MIGIRFNVLMGLRLCRFSLEDEQMRSLFFCSIMITGLGLSSAEARARMRLILEANPNTRLASATSDTAQRVVKPQWHA
jgi:hypothetical protein